jgi:hypothetical protein
MVPNSDSTRNDNSDDGQPTLEGDGGVAPGFDEAALFTVIRAAVKDALLNVIGTVLLVGIAFVLVVAGGQALISSASPIGAAIGGLLVLVGVYLAAATLELIPPLRAWF